MREAEEDAKGIRERAEAEGRERLDEVRKAFEDLQGKLGTKAEVDPGPVVVPEPQPPPVPEPAPARYRSPRRLSRRPIPSPRSCRSRRRRPTRATRACGRQRREVRRRPRRGAAWWR